MQTSLHPPRRQLQSHWRRTWGALILAFQAVVISAQLPGLVYSGSELDTFFKLLNQSAAVQAEVVGGNCTVLGPTSDAFAKYNLNHLTADDRDALLHYHVIQGIYASEVLSGQIVEARGVDAQVQLVSTLWHATTIVTPDIIFNNGIIHSIADVLTIPTELGDTVTQTRLTAYIALGEQLGKVTPPNMTTLSDIQIWPNVTILAPNNSRTATNYTGWDDLTPPGVLEVWDYHLINGSALYSTDLTPGQQIKTAGGLDITIYQANGSTFINDAKIIKSDLLIANGVMQIIDRPLNSNATSAHPKLNTIGSPLAKSSGLPIGAKAGIAIGVVAAVLALTGCLAYFWRRSRKAKTTAAAKWSSQEVLPAESQGTNEVAQMDDTGVGELPSRSRLGELSSRDRSSELGYERAPWESGGESHAIELEAKRYIAQLP